MSPTVDGKEARDSTGKLDVHKCVEPDGMQPAQPEATGQCHCKATLSCLKVGDDQGSFLMSGKRQTSHPSSRRTRRIQETTGCQPNIPGKVTRQILLETISKNVQDKQVTGKNPHGLTKGGGR